MDIDNRVNQVRNLINFSPPYLNDIKPSEWAEQKRVMTSDTSPFPGKFSYEKTPYLKEVVDCLSPEHPARVISVIKGSQLGFSTGVIETGIGWIIDQSPGNILLSARDEALVKKMIGSKIDPMIDSCGLRHKIRPNAMRKRNQRSGDTDFSKEFGGGSLMAVSIQNPARMRQFSAQYGFLDDFEAAPHSKDAGAADKLFETRFDAYFTKMKLFYVSTPEIKQTSNIEPLFLKGDQRKYFIPCPCCGSYIELHWRFEREDGSKAGMKWKLDNHGRVVEGSVGYVCQDCDGFFSDKKKTDFNLAGQWKPTAEPTESGYYSYHLSSLYAPIGMYDWEHYAKSYNECCPKGGDIDIEAYKTFVNTTLGKTWEAKSKSNSAKGLMLNTREYEHNTIPARMSNDDGNGDIMMITCGADLGGTIDDARLDYEVVAWSSNGVSYSITHGSIGTFVNKSQKGKHFVEDKDREVYSYSDNKVWDEFKDVLNTIFLDEDGREYSINVTALDTGHFTAYANNFIYSCDELVFGVKGLGSKIMKEDSDSPLFKKSKEQAKLFLVDVNRVKDRLSENMDLKWNVDMEQPVGFMNYPMSVGDKYSSRGFYKHYESEKRVVDKNRGIQWVKKHSSVQNHFYDCRIYNMAIKDIFVSLVCKENKVPVSDVSFETYVQIINGLY